MKERAGETAPQTVSQFDPQASGKPSAPKPSGYVWEDVGGTTNKSLGHVWSLGTHICVVHSWSLGAEACAVVAGPSKATLIQWRGSWQVVVDLRFIGQGNCLTQALARRAAEQRFEAYLSTGA